MSSGSPTPAPGTVCEQCGRKFPHLGKEIAPGLTKWFCNEGHYRIWKAGEDKKEPFKVTMGRLP